MTTQDVLNELDDYVADSDKLTISREAINFIRSVLKGNGCNKCSRRRMYMEGYQDGYKDACKSIDKENGKWQL